MGLNPNRAGFVRNEPRVSLPVTISACEIPTPRLNGSTTWARRLRTGPPVSWEDWGKYAVCTLDTAFSSRCTGGPRADPHVGGALPELRGSEMLGITLHPHPHPHPNCQHQPRPCHGLTSTRSYEILWKHLPFKQGGCKGVTIRFNELHNISSLLPAQRERLNAVFPRYPCPSPRH